LSDNDFSGYFDRTVLARSERSSRERANRCMTDAMTGIGDSPSRAIMIASQDRPSRFQPAGPEFFVEVI
jgi:hypothetical protein